MRSPKASRFIWVFPKMGSSQYPKIHISLYYRNLPRRIPVFSESPPHILTTGVFFVRVNGMHENSEEAQLSLVLWTV